MSRGFFSLRSFLYLVYAVILTAVILYLRFPTEKFRHFCERHVEFYLSGSTCSIERIGYLFPFSLTVNNVQISQEVDGQISRHRIGFFTVAPDFTDFLQRFAINGEMYKGSFALDLRVDRSGKSFRINEVTLKDVDIEEWINDFGLLGRKVTGTANFSGEYQGTFANFSGGLGKGELLVVDGRLQLLQPVLSITDFAYERIIVKMEHEKGALNFIEGEVLGNEIKANFTGTLGMTTPFLASNMSLSGSMIPSKEFLAANPAEKKVVEQLLRRYKMSVLPFKVGGSVQTPTFRFSI
jgi:type II secretion system protein N